jgi:3',5'-cyclic AMP phosphodiesterase CpdA
MIRDKVIHLTDLHFWKVVVNPIALLNKRALGNVNVFLRRRHEFHMENAARYVEALRATGVTTLLLGGDYTSTAHPAEFALARDYVETLARAGFRIIAIPGNHDVYTFESVRKRRFEQYLGAYTPEAGLPCRVELPGGTPLVLAPTVCPNVISSAGRIGDAAAARVRELVAGAAPGPVLVMGHYPLLHETYAYRSGKSRQLRNAEALRAALGATGREVLYLAGHVHRFSHVRDTAHAKLRHVTSNAFFLQRHGDAVDGSFTELHCGTEGFEVLYHWHAGGWHTRTEAAQ